MTISQTYQEQKEAYYKRRTRSSYQFMISFIYISSR